MLWQMTIVLHGLPIVSNRTRIELWGAISHSDSAPGASVHVERRLLGVPRRDVRTTDMILPRKVIHSLYMNIAFHEKWKAQSEVVHKAKHIGEKWKLALCRDLT